MARSENEKRDKMAWKLIAAMTHFGMNANNDFKNMTTNATSEALKKFARGVIAPELSKIFDRLSDALTLKP